MKARRRLAMAGVIVAAALTMTLGVAGTASAGHCPPGATYPADCVHGIDVTPTTVATDVQGTEVVQSNGGTGNTGANRSSASTAGRLPVTGGDVVGLAVMGLGAVAVGFFLVRRSRRPA